MAEKRKIIKIDEEKCNGCGLCVPSCAEGAIQIIDGKARLVSETFCDGLGACLGECPEGALTIEEREADGFDEKEVEKHLEQMKKHAAAVEPPRVHGGCPGSLARSLEPKAPPKAAESGAPTPSQLRNWPVQLHLAPVKAPYFKDAKLLIAADCVPFAYADFHKDFLADRVVIIGCPKLDDSSAYLEKLINIFAQNDRNPSKCFTWKCHAASGSKGSWARLSANQGKTSRQRR